MSEQVPRKFTIPFFSFILIILCVASWLIGGSIFDHLHDSKAILILAIVELAVMIGTGLIVSSLFTEIKEIKRK